MLKRWLTLIKILIQKVNTTTTCRSLNRANSVNWCWEVHLLTPIPTVLIVFIFFINWWFFFLYHKTAVSVHKLDQHPRPKCWLLTEAIPHDLGWLLLKHGSEMPEKSGISSFSRSIWPCLTLSVTTRPLLLKHCARLDQGDCFKLIPSLQNFKVPRFSQN